MREGEGERGERKRGRKRQIEGERIYVCEREGVSERKNMKL